jgi:hypothetical protein
LYLAVVSKLELLNGQVLEVLHFNAHFLWELDLGEVDFKDFQILRLANDSDGLFELDDAHFIAVVHIEINGLAIIAYYL